MKSHFSEIETLSLDAFKEMDYLAVEKYALPIELMMENAGLQLANLIANSANEETEISIGIGNGNNGGGGLVAARRLAAWGFNVYLDMPVEITKELPKQQLKRAIRFGAKRKTLLNPDIWVDAYLGFSQRLPLSDIFQKTIRLANASSAYRIALDIPIGISDDKNYSGPIFNAHQVLTLAGPKTILKHLPTETDIRIADIGIPKAVYKKYKISMPSFFEHQIIKLN